MSFSSWLFIGVSSIVVYCILEAIYRYRYTSRGKKKLPTATPWPLIGNALHFLKDRTNEGLFKAFETYLPDSPVSGLWIGPKFLLMISDAASTNALLTKGIASKKPREIYKIFDYAGDGIFATRNEEKWRLLRKPLDKTLHPKYLESWLEVFDKNAKRFRDSIAANPTSFVMDLMTCEYSMLNITETHLGITDLTDLKKKLPRVHHDLDELMNMLMLRMFDLTGEFNCIYELTKNYKILNGSVSRLLVVLTELFEQRIAHLKKIDVGDEWDECFADHVLKYAKEQKIDGVLRSQVAADFVGAAVHTTQNNLASAFLYLAMHPEIQEKVYKEQCDLMGDSDHVPTVEEINKMVYLEMVIKESFRHSGVPGVARKLEKDVELGDYVAPAGALIWFNMLMLNRSSKYWEKPLEFYPEHFTPEAEAKRPKGAYNPFSQGMRGCPGRLYATTQMKVAISVAIRRYFFTTNLRFENIKFHVNVVRTPESFDCVAHLREPIKTK